MRPDLDRQGKGRQKKRKAEMCTGGPKGDKTRPRYQKEEKGFREIKHATRSKRDLGS